MERPVLLVLGVRHKRQAAAQEALATWDKHLAARPEAWVRLLADPGCAARILEQARTYPLGAERQLVWVEEADRLHAADQAHLTTYLEHPAPFSMIVLAADSWDRRTAFYKAIAAKKWVLSCEEEGTGSSAQEFDRWARARAIRLEEGARRYLAGQLELSPDLLPDLQARLELFAEPGQALQEAAARALAPETVATDAFALLDDFFSGRPAEGVKRLRSLSRRSEEWTELVGAIHWSARRMWIAARLHAHVSPVGLARELGVSPSRARELAERAQRLGRGKIERLIEELSEIDAAFKVSSPNAAERLEFLLMSLSVTPKGA